MTRGNRYFRGSMARGPARRRADVVHDKRGARGCPAILAPGCPGAGVHFDRVRATMKIGRHARAASTAEAVLLPLPPGGPMSSAASKLAGNGRPRYPVYDDSPIFRMACQQLESVAEVTA